MSESTCKWCKRRPATEHDHDTLPEDTDGGLCWREWGLNTPCHQIEERMKEAAPELLEVLQSLIDECKYQSELGNFDENRIEITKANAAIAKATGKEDV